MRKALVLVIIVLNLTGCSALVDRAEDYVKQEAFNRITAELDIKLQQQGVSLAQVTSALADSEGHITKHSLAVVAKESITEIAFAEGKKLVDAEINKLATKNDLDSTATKIWKWLAGSILGLVSGYLGKQIVGVKRRAKKDKAFHDRLQMLERLTGQDLDGSGTIGKTPPPPAPASSPITQPAPIERRLDLE
jgi:hypothetical protein